MDAVLQSESAEIVQNAQTAYEAGEITAEQYLSVTLIPMMDAALDAQKEGSSQ